MFLCFELNTFKVQAIGAIELEINQIKTYLIWCWKEKVFILCEVRRMLLVTFLHLRIESDAQTYKSHQLRSRALHIPERQHLDKSKIHDDLIRMSHK